MQELSIKEELLNPVSFNIENPTRCERKFLEKFSWVKYMYNAEFFGHFKLHNFVALVPAFKLAEN